MAQNHILYYSNFCEKSKKCIHHLSNTSVKDDIHFLCVDKRIQKNNATYLVIQEKHEVMLPPTVTKVPALLLLNKGHHVLFGDQIYNYFESRITQEQQVATMSNEEPVSFSLSQMNHVSDNFSFLDQSVDELSTKGNGGLRQLNHYAKIETTDNIDTPPDTYKADTIGDVSLDKMMESRNRNI